MINRFIKIFHYLKTNFIYRIFFKAIGTRIILMSPLLLSGVNCVSLGNRVFIRNDARIEVVKFHNKEKFNPYISIGDNVSIEQRLHLTAASYLCIEKGTTILFDVMITDIDHDYNDITQAISKQNLIIKKTSIGENCFIGSGAKIQAGTILGKHCVIGTNSVVRGHFPDYCVIVGVPARIIKKYDFACKEWKKTDKYGTFLDE